MSSARSIARSMTRARAETMTPQRQAVHLTDSELERLSALVADTMGLNFPRERFADLERGLVSACEELGFQDATACADWFLSVHPTTAQLEVLASHLTIGETYFFREPRTFDVLADTVLPELIRARRGREQRLRLWSAACCSGEEAYSLAILVRRLLPDLPDWQVTILATDINARFLQKAIGGSYGEWSFRGTPAGFRDRYFSRAADRRYTILPEIRRMVTFEHLNLVEDVYPSLATDTNAMDVIFCRNALMYFTPAQARKVIGNLHHALVGGGWLAVSPSEASHTLFPQFLTRNFPGVILYQKSAPAPARARERRTAAAQGAPSRLPAARRPPAGAAVPPTLRERRPLEEAPFEEQPTPYDLATSLYERGEYGEAARRLLELAADDRCRADVFSLLARALANEGRLVDALTWCDRWIAADKVHASGHYLRGMILLEQGAQEEAQRSLRRAVYLQGDFVLAHFALGSLARSRGRHEEADRHFANALHLLARLQPHEILPESEGLTAGRLTETISALREQRVRA